MLETMQGLVALMQTSQFWLDVSKIIMIDLLLSGDNAVVIALACRNLPEAQRRKGIMYGVGGAIGLRIVLTFFAVGLLSLPYLKLIGALKGILQVDDLGDPHRVIGRGNDAFARGHLLLHLGQRLLLLQHGIDRPVLNLVGGNTHQ